MSKAADMDSLRLLHRLQAQGLIMRLEQDLRDGIPTDAATLGAINKFLKDNEVTADPADTDDLQEMRDRLTRQQNERKARAKNVIDLASGDLLEATG